MDLKEARELAIVALSARGLSQGRELVLLDEHTLELSSAWIFAYESAAFVASGQREHRLIGNGPIYVRKDTGAVSFLGTYAPRDRVVADFERQSQ